MNNFFLNFNFLGKKQLRFPATHTLADYKLKTLTVEDNDTNMFIKECLLNNTDPLMIEKINLVTYAGNIQIDNNI